MFSRFAFHSRLPHQVLLTGCCSVAAGLFFGHFPLLMSGGAVCIFVAGLLKNNPAEFVNNRFAILLSALLLLHFFNGFWCNHMADWAHISFRKLSLFLIAFGLACCPLPATKFRWVVFAFLLSAIAAASATLVNYLLHKQSFDAGLLMSRQIPVPTGVMHIQFGVLLAFGVLLSVVICIWPAAFFTGNANKGRWLVAVVGLYLLICVHVLCSRTGWVSLYAGLVALGVWQMVSHKKWKQAAGALLMLCMLPVAAYYTSAGFRNRVLNTADDLGRYWHGEYHGYYSVSQRLDAWRCGWQVYKQQPFTGVGSTDIKEEMLEMYPHLGMAENLYVHETHNQFLHELVGKGPLGLLVLLLGIGVFWRMASRRALPLAFIVVMVVSFLFENMLEHQAGLTFYSLFGMLFYQRQPS